MPLQLKSPKPYLDYPALVALLESRGMTISDKLRAERKLSQIGYYRLSGFWYPCRLIQKDSGERTIINTIIQKPVRLESFQPNTDFQSIIQLYLFDKKLRQLMLDAIERIEVHIRSVIAHEVGYHHPLAYQDQFFINPSQTRDWVDDRNGKTRNIWKEWTSKHKTQISRSREDCINWHKMNNQEMPFWVVVEAWDFGLMSKYYEILKQKYQNRIASRLGVSNASVLKDWLQEINTLRNRCAHHTRIWNQKNNAALPIIPNAYFNNLALDQNALERIYGLISIIWFLIQKIGPNSEWLNCIADLIDSKPNLLGCPYTSMGFGDEHGFPKNKFKPT